MTSATPATESDDLPTTGSTEVVAEKMLEPKPSNGSKVKPSAWTGANMTIIQQQQQQQEKEESNDKQKEQEEGEAPSATEAEEENTTTFMISDEASGGSTVPPPSTTISPSSTNTSPPASPVDDIVDSALLAALRDARERIALLKLEQVLIEYLERHQPQERYIDVGGPYNSMVVSPTQGQLGVPMQEIHAGILNLGEGNVIQGNGPNSFRPQTTFQRCILHRLCDRFRMTREKSYVDDGFGYYIRIVRQPDSCMPPRLLSTLPSSEYAPVHESTSSGSLSASFEQMGVSGDAAVSDGNACNLPSAAPTAQTATKNSKPRKMKIMKRASSGSVSANGGDNSKASNKNSTKQQRNSSLSEKERKYAEARARIFQQEEGSGNDSAPATTTSPASDSQEANTNDNRPHSSASSRSSVTPNHHTPPRTASGVGNPQPENRGKATYRNRQQEEADPDFRRGGRMVVTQQPAQAVPGWSGGGATATPYYPNATMAGGRGYYGQQTQHQQQYHHAQHHQKQQYQKQYYAGPHAGHHQGSANVVVLPQMPAGAVMYPQVPSHAAGRGGMHMATGSGTAGAGATNNGQQAPYHATATNEQFPALR
ncbi:MAG: hypothetical protein SGILL_000377 [Bacillariaceae sp.]